MARGFGTRGFVAKETGVGSLRAAARASSLPEVKDEALKPERSQEAGFLASEYRAKATELEPKLTSMLAGLADKLGGKMEGLQFRLKSTDSIARKIDKEVATGMAKDRAQAAAEMGDMIRHTVAFNEGTYTGGVAKMVETLQNAGYKLSIRNFWKDGDPYQGININLEKDGVKTELQFHTKESLKAKEEAHVDYEKYRDTKTSKEEKNILFRKMTEMASKIPKPKQFAKLLAIGSLIVQSID